MKLLLTAFDPFGGSSVNPALEAVKLVADRIGDVEIIKLEVPTVFGKSVNTVAAKMAEVKPDAVLCIGQAGGRYDLTPERVAINLDDARIPDNEGNQPIDEVIFADGAPAYFSSLPIKAMVAKIRQSGLPAFRVANLSYDLQTLKEAQEASAQWIDESGTSDLPEAVALRARIRELFRRADGTMN